MKALLVLFDEQDRIFFKHPLEAPGMEGMLPALFLELSRNVLIEAQWKNGHHFHILTIAETGDMLRPVTDTGTLNFIANCHSNGLTRTEINVALELRTGKAYKDMASALHCTVNTVHTHLNHIYDKLQVKNRHAAVKKLEGRMGVV